MSYIFKVRLYTIIIKKIRELAKILNSRALHFQSYKMC